MRGIDRALYPSSSSGGGGGPSHQSLAIYPRDEWGGLWERHGARGPDCACGGAWSAENQKGFAKMLTLELGFDRYIGASQGVSRTSGVPDTRKRICTPEKCQTTGNSDRRHVAGAQEQTEEEWPQVRVDNEVRDSL